MPITAVNARTCSPRARSLKRLGWKTYELPSTPLLRFRACCWRRPIPRLALSSRMARVLARVSQYEINALPALFANWLPTGPGGLNAAVQKPEYAANPSRPIPTLPPISIIHGIGDGRMPTLTARQQPSTLATFIVRGTALATPNKFWYWPLWAAGQLESRLGPGSHTPSLTLL